MKYYFDENDRSDKVKKILKEILIWTVEILAVIAIAFLIVQYGLQKTTMVGNSMEPTLKQGDELLINKFAYGFMNPKRYDIIVFKQSGKEHSYYDIKRVIGLPGETVLIKNGQIYINGEVLKEEYKFDKIDTRGLAEEEVLLDTEEFFVLGDQRNNSEDSRFATVGNILKDDIIGKAWIQLSPFRFISQLGPKQDKK